MLPPKPSRFAFPDEVLSQLGVKFGLLGKTARRSPQRGLDTLDIAGKQIDLNQHCERKSISRSKPIGLFQCMAGARKITNRYGSGGDTKERVVCANAVGSGAVRLLKIFRSLRELAMPKFDLGFSAQVTELFLTLLRAQFDRGTLSGQGVCARQECRKY